MPGSQWQEDQIYYARQDDAQRVVTDPRLLFSLIRMHLKNAHIQSEIWRAENTRLTEAFPDVGSRRTACNQSLVLRDSNGARRTHLELAEMYKLAFDMLKESPGAE